MTNNENPSNFMEPVTEMMKSLVRDIYGEDGVKALEEELRNGDCSVMCTPFGIGIGVGNPKSDKATASTCKPSAPKPVAPKTPTTIPPKSNVAQDFKKQCNGDHACNCNNVSKVNNDPVSIKKPQTTLAYGATNQYINNSGEYVINVLLPGFTKENINVSYVGKVLTVEALYVSNVEFAPEKVLVKTVREEFRGAERIKRDFVLDNALFENASMTLENGILNIVVPRKQEDAPKKISFVD